MFGQWGSRWLKYGSAAGWFAYFLHTESGQVLLPQGVKQACQNRKGLHLCTDVVPIHRIPISYSKPFTKLIKHKRKL